MEFLETYSLYLNLINKKTDEKLDLSKLTFIDPMLILLLFDYLRNNEYIPPDNPPTRNYIDIMIKTYNKPNPNNRSYLPVTSIN
ncbi:hypothetical protein Mia14_0924 [Candidatus Mancarchaeum acidiphilum]|uniref:Uncharacterized protein n=1 Tax=Candidatus Mancarchaeum acidiphilum TaxID=1920749 RepID=A0A218NNY9_9ARCH|nr:hypothetical protein Mia14_0924 [Candidatus Mancarchaeum acidiphilum]